jgi:hypothetical protein
MAANEYFKTSNLSAITFNPPSHRELAIYAGDMHGATTARLAVWFEFMMTHNDNGAAVPVYVIDAKTNDVLQHYNNLQTGGGGSMGRGRGGIMPPPPSMF